MSNRSDLHGVQWEEVEEATELLLEGQTDAAVAHLTDVLRRDPSNAYAHYFMAGVCFEREDFESARASYATALRHAPGYRGALLGLGHACRLLGRLEEAVRAGERALAMAGDRGDADAHFLLGTTYAVGGNTAEAIRHIEAYLASHPEMESRYEAEALLQTLQGKARPLEPADD